MATLNAGSLGMFEPVLRIDHRRERRLQARPFDWRQQTVDRHHAIRAISEPQVPLRPLTLRRVVPVFQTELELSDRVTKILNTLTRRFIEQRHGRVVLRRRFQRQEMLRRHPCLRGEVRAPAGTWRTPLRPCVDGSPRPATPCRGAGSRRFCHGSPVCFRLPPHALLALREAAVPNPATPAHVL